MFGISGVELLIILIFGFIIFGPEKLPQVAKTIGRAIAKFREVQQEAKENINLKSFVDLDSDEPLKDPIEAISKVKDKATASFSELSEDASTLKEAAGESLAEKKKRYDEARAAKNASEGESKIKNSERGDE